LAAIDILIIGVIVFDGVGTCDRSADVNVLDNWITAIGANLVEVIDRIGMQAAMISGRAFINSNANLYNQMLLNAGGPAHVDHRWPSRPDP
jgi:hypothetical protein